MTPTLCAWTHENIIPEADEILAAAWAEYLAGNTGWLFSEPPWEWMGNLALDSISQAGTSTSYLSAGSYRVYAHLRITSGSHRVTMDGTEVVSGQIGGSGFGASVGTLGWTASAAGWYAITAERISASGEAYVSAFRQHV